MPPISTISFQTLRRWTVGVLVLFASLAVSSPGIAATGSVAAAAGREVNPPGDIPDDQAFVPYTPASGAFVVRVPEGWARTESGTGSGATTSFTDKLNTIRMSVRPVATAPTMASVIATEFPQIKQSDAKVTGGKASRLTRKAGPVIKLAYQRDGTANTVTGRAAREAVERYEFWRNGVAVTLSLSGPVGADNVDPWKIVTDSFAWK